MFFVIIIVFALLGALVSGRLKSKFKKYSKVPIAGGLTGKQIAEKMLYDSGINDVKVVSVAGSLTDHYNPKNKTINLSQEVFHGNSVASAAVAAHETGHAVQHATAYAFLQLRSVLVPVVSVASQMLSWVLGFGIIFVIMTGLFNNPTFLLAIVLAQGAVTLFTLITLPVEFDASARGLIWLRNSGLATTGQEGQARDALKWAAMTYLVSALAAITQLLYFLMMFLNSRD